MGVRARYVRTEKTSVSTAPPQMLNAETNLTSSPRFSPSRREIRLLPPMPNRLPSAVSRLNHGNTSDTAATIYGLPICPIKNVSARL